MTGLGWFDARDLARTGKAIRRSSWSRWMIRGPSLWYSVTFDTDGNPTVLMLTTADFTAAEFMATDWTDEAFDSNQPPSGTVLPKLTSGNHNFGSDQNPPGPGSLFHLAGATADENPRPVFTHTPPSGQVPVVSADVVRFDLLNLPTGVYVRLAVMGGPPGTGTFSVQLDTETPVTGTAWPGFDELIEFPDIVVVPGSTLSVTASYTNTVSTYTVDSTTDVDSDPLADLTTTPASPSLAAETLS